MINRKKIEHDQIEGLRLLADQVVNMLEQEFNDNSNKNIDPEDISNVIETNRITKYFSTSSILFADFVGFTKLVEIMEPGD